MILQILLRVGFGKRAAEDGEILREDVGEAAVDAAVAGDEAIAGDDLLVHAEIAAAVLDELVDFFEGAFVEQQFDAFAGGEFAFFVLALAAFGTSAFFGGGVAAAEFFEAVHECSGYRAMGLKMIRLTGGERIESNLTTGMEPSDEVAIGRASRGDRDAFRVLVERHAKAVFRVAYRMTADANGRRGHGPGNVSASVEGDCEVRRAGFVPDVAASDLRESLAGFNTTAAAEKRYATRESRGRRRLVRTSAIGVADAGTAGAEFADFRAPFACAG